MDSLVAPPETDMVAGGWYKSKSSALDNKALNSAIGGKWSNKGRVSYRKTQSLAVDGSQAMDVELTICPLGKKGKGENKMHVKLKKC